MSQSKTYHTIDKDELEEHKDWFDPIHGCHYIDLPNGRVLVAANFANEHQEHRFHTLTKTRKSLPHPVFNGHDKLHPDHHEELGHMFNEDDEHGDGVTHVSQATVHHVIRRAHKLHPLMKLSVF